MLHHGSRVFVLDTKRISHLWARGLPRVTCCADVADIHDQLIALGIEGRRRTRVADELGIGADPKAIGPRLLILLEEVNATMKQLARYWERIREAGDPKVSPAGLPPSAVRPNRQPPPPPSLVWSGPRSCFRLRFAPDPQCS